MTAAQLAPVQDPLESADADLERRKHFLRKQLAEGHAHPARLRLLRSELRELDRPPDNVTPNG